MNKYEIRRQNLNFLIEKHFGGKTKLAAELFEKLPTHISRLRTGRNAPGTTNGNIGNKMARFIEEKLNLEPDSLDTPLWMEDAALGIEYNIKHAIDSDSVKLELFKSLIGTHKEISNYILFEEIKIPKKTLYDLFGTTNLQGIKLFPVSSDNMAPTIPSKAITLINTSINEFETDGIYLFTFEDELLLKRLSRGKGGVLHVISDNKLYMASDFTIEKHEFESLKIYGKYWKGLFLDVIE